MSTTRATRGTLSRDVLVREAIALADAEGVARLSMRRLAERLGVEAMSLYHHVANKDALLDAMVDGVFAEITLPVVGGNWTAELRARMESARGVMVAHRWAVGLMDSRTSPGLATIRHHDAVIGCLRAGGFSISGAAHAFSLVDSYLYGFVVQEVSLPFGPGTDAELEEVAEGIMAALPREQFPHFSEMVSEHALKPGYAYSEEFGIGLELLLDGLARVRDRW